MYMSSLVLPNYVMWLVSYIMQYVDSEDAMPHIAIGSTPDCRYR